MSKKKFLDKKNKQGGWSIFTVMVMPLLILALFYFVTYNTVHDSVELRVQNGLDSSLIALSDASNIYSILDKNGVLISQTSYDDDKLNEIFSTKVYYGILKQINGYNDDWEIRINGENDNFEYVTFADFASNYQVKDYAKNVLNKNINEDGNETITLCIRGVVPKKRITDYNEYYKNGGWTTNTNTSDWIKFEVEATATCK